jgi:hypothetical protein
MSDEATDRSGGASDSGRPVPGGGGIGSPFQTRAAFLKNWDWVVIIGINRRACARGGAQHGINSEAGAACEAKWEALHQRELTLAETFDSLRGFHREVPFLFFNGNTFATIGRELSLALFRDLSPGRKREISAAVAHYIAGVLDRESMIQIVEGLSREASFYKDDRVKTLRGSLRGRVVRVQGDGRIVWKPESGTAELIALPENLLLDE